MFPIIRYKILVANKNRIPDLKIGGFVVDYILHELYKDCKQSRDRHNQHWIHMDDKMKVYKVNNVKILQHEYVQLQN